MGRERVQALAALGRICGFEVRRERRSIALRGQGWAEEAAGRAVLAR